MWTIVAAALLVGGPPPPPGRLLGSPPLAFGTAGDDPAGRAVAAGKATEGRKSGVSVLCGLGDSPQALQTPLPSVRLRLTASSPDGGRSLLGGRFPAGKPAETETHSTSEKRLVREAGETEHSQGAPRTATVADDVKSLCPFGRRGEGHTCNTQLAMMQPTHGVVLRIVPARRTKRAMKGI